MTRHCVILLLLLAIAALTCRGGSGFEGHSEYEEQWREQEGHHGEEEEQEGIFLLEKSKKILKTEAGEVSLRSRKRYAMKPPHDLHIVFISMEPKSFFVPQYLDSDSVFYVLRGFAKVGWVHHGDFIEKNLKIGDVYRIPGGSVFYILNTDEGQRLHITCGLDTSYSLSSGSFQSFFVAGGEDPVAVLSAFDDHVLSVAFNVSRSELDTILSRQSRGPIIYIEDRGHKRRRSPSFFSFPNEGSWDWGNIIESFNRWRRRPDGFNIFKKKPDFRNDYGWSLAVDRQDYPALKEPDIGIFYVNLSAGAMMAPHFNPRATEYGIVTRGEGRIHIAFPNGTNAMDVSVGVGDVFWVPQYYPVCQIAARSGPMEFFGFTSSSRKNRPQFLAGRNSIFNIMKSRSLASAFNLSEKRFKEISQSQGESVILPPLTRSPATPQREKEREKKEREEEREEEREREREHSFFSVFI